MIKLSLHSLYHTNGDNSVATIDFYLKKVVNFAHFWQICLNLSDEKQNLSDG